MSDAVKDPNTPKKRFRWSRVVLVVSLGLNLMVLGIVGGAIAGKGGPSRVDVLSFGPYTAALEDADRRALRREVFADGKSLRGMRKLLRQDFEAVLEALRATPFDAAQFEALMAAPTDRIAAQAGYVRQQVLEMIVTMEPDERAAYADRLEAKLRKGPPRKDKAPKPPRPPQSEGAY